MLATLRERKSFLRPERFNFVANDNLPVSEDRVAHTYDVSCQSRTRNAAGADATDNPRHAFVFA